MDQYWIIQPSIIITKWYEIFPKKNMSRNQIINSLFRFSIILIIIFIAVKSYFLWYFIPLFIIFISTFAGGEDVKIKEPNCRKSTLNNPYMNRSQRGEKAFHPISLNFTRLRPKTGQVE